MRFAMTALGGLVLLGLLAGIFATRNVDKTSSGQVMQADVQTWADVPAYDAGQAGRVLAAFRRHCRGWMKSSHNRAMGGELGVYGKRVDWLDTCEQAAGAEDAPAFFRTAFRPVRIRAADGKSKLTGYFQPQYRGSLKQGGDYQTPVFGRPDDLVMVNLGRFDKDWRGRRLAGRVVAGQLLPYDDRAAISDGALSGKAQVLAWLADPVDVFFMEIQGSGQIILPDGKILQLGYAAQNGHAYRPIGRDLIRMGAVRREDMSMAAIRDWLTAHPDDAQGVMNKNRSYVFFRTQNRAGAIGAAGRVLTDNASIAVDRKFHALGVPMLLTSGKATRLVLAEDTGGAIRGPVRADLYVGAGDEAGRIAGSMNQPMALTVLLPRRLADRLAAQTPD